MISLVAVILVLVCFNLYQKTAVKCKRVFSMPRPKQFTGIMPTVNLPKVILPKKRVVEKKEDAVHRDQVSLNDRVNGHYMGGDLMRKDMGDVTHSLWQTVSSEKVVGNDGRVSESMDMATPEYKNQMANKMYDLVGTRDGKSMVSLYKN